MDTIMKYMMETYGYLIQTDKDNGQFAFNETIDSLNLTQQEKAFIKLTFRTNGIEVLSMKKEKTIEEKRPERVRDYNYGEIQSNGLESADKPKIAEIKYEGEELVFENYEELDDYIINEFIPNHVQMKINKSKNSKMGLRYSNKDLENDEQIQIDSRKVYPSIRLEDIVKLKLSEKEVVHVVELLQKEGIRIGGTSQDLDSEFMNYDYIRTYATKRYEKPLSVLEEREKFIEYQKTHDPLLREELIVRNLRLVPYIAWKLALRHNLDHEEVESFGYEGLVIAIDKYDPSFNVKFATYAIPCISGHIKHSIAKLKNFPAGLYFDFQRVRYIVEKEWGEKYNDDPEMLKDILDVMYAGGIIDNELRYRELYRYFLSQKSVSFEQLKEDDIAITGSTLTNDLDERCYSHILHDMLNEALETLTSREKSIIEMRFGLVDGHAYTLTEVANEYKLTVERIRQIEAKALRKLRHPGRSRALRELLDSIDLNQGDDEPKILYDNGEEKNKTI